MLGTHQIPIWRMLARASPNTYLAPAGLPAARDNLAPVEPDLDTVGNILSEVFTTATAKLGRSVAKRDAHPESEKYQEHRRATSW